MATFDTLIDDLAGRFGLGADARTLVKEVLTMISTSQGGLGGFLDRLKSGGLTSEVGSWLGRPDAAPIAAGQIERALGATALGGVASRLGLGQSAVSTALGYALPKIIGLLTPGGVVPAGVPAEVTAFLSQPRVAAVAEQVAPKRIDTIANFAAVKAHGVQAEGNGAGASPQVLAELASLIAAGKLEVPIAATYPLADVRAAYTELARGHTHGKIVLLP